MTGKIAVLGAGAWGIALGHMLAYSGHRVNLWARTRDAADAINERHQTPRLYDLPLHPALRADTDAEHVLTGAEAVVSAVVSHQLRGFLRAVTKVWPRDAMVVSASKGLERGTCKRMTQILKDELPQVPKSRLAVLSGPNLAGEMARGKPASTVVAGHYRDTARYFQKLFHSERFRVYTSEDVTGVELGGAMKNVIAIAAGMCSGLALGDNAVAAVATRGIAEIKRLGVQMGANPETFSGMAGVGDIVVTCCSQGSRNRKVGEEIGRGKPPMEAVSEKKTVAEGVHTVVALYQLSRTLGVSLPISEIVYKVLFEDFPVSKAARELMGRDAKEENE